MNFIQIGGASLDPTKIHSLAALNLLRTRCPVICVNFHPPLSDVVFLFRSEKDRDEKFNDIRKRQEVF